MELREPSILKDRDARFLERRVGQDLALDRRPVAANLVGALVPLALALLAPVLAAAAAALLAALLAAIAIVAVAVALAAFSAPVRLVASALAAFLAMRRRRRRRRRNGGIAVARLALLRLRTGLALRS